MAEGLERHFSTRGEVVRALDGVSFELAPSQIVAITGPSGSGKSTLLNLLGGLERPTAGRLLVQGQELGRFDHRQLAAYRRRQVGMVFQSFNLVPRLSALDNVALPMLLDGVLKPAERRERAAELLGSVGLAARTSHRPAELSGGEQQRVAIARALANSPQLLLADEPTGNLDSRRAAEILDLLLALNRDRGIALVMVTHDDHVASLAGRRLRMQDGRVAG